MWGSRVWRLASGIVVVVGVWASLGAAKPGAASGARWLSWKTTTHTTINPYAPWGRYEDGSVFASRRCTITGTPGNDVLHGTPGNDVICGLGGNDIIDGGAGNDVIDGGAGADRIHGGSGNDILLGGAGNDAIVGGAGNERLFGGTGRDRISAGSGQDLVHGGPGPDRIYGGGGDDRLYGDAGNDTILAKDGSRDLVDGGRGEDFAVADLQNPEHPHATTDRLVHILEYFPPLAVGQYCEAWWNHGLSSVWCQGTGPTNFGNVPENETVQFTNTNGPTGTLSYVGLHGQHDTLTLKPGESAEVGLGGGHWYTNYELRLTGQGNTASDLTTFTVTGIQAQNLFSIGVGQYCTTDTSVACQATSQFGNVPQNLWVWFQNESQTSKAKLNYIGLHGSHDSVDIGPGQTEEVGLGGGHYGDSSELTLDSSDGSSVTVAITQIQDEN